MICPTCNTPNRDDAKFCKKCGQSFHTEPAPTAAASAPANVQVQETEQSPSSSPFNPAMAEDITSAPTLIISPEQMQAFHARRRRKLAVQQQEQSEAQPDAEMSPLASASVPSSANGQAQSEQVQDNPRPLASPTGASSPPLASASPPSGAESALPEQEDLPTENIPIAAANAAATPHQQEEVHKVAQPSQPSPLSQDATDQAETAQPAQQPAATPAAGDFPPLAVGTIVAGRYEVTHLEQEEANEHRYQVTDHQGYQHCWNCNSEQNGADDEFCIDCGAELLNASYTMHEYSGTETKDAEAHVIAGKVVNTFVDQGRTYMIEQVQSVQNAFPNGLRVLAACDSDAGNIRRSDPNEDSTLVLQLQRVHESVATPVGVYIVADGMGGHDNGQGASRLTISTIAERIARELLLAPLSAETSASASSVASSSPLAEDTLVSLLQGAVEDANAALCQVNQRNKTDMGSTITGFMLVGEHAYILNVGDSRTYMLRNGQIYQLTNDHSLVGQLVAGGLIQPDDVYTHPQRSQIFRSLGDKLNVQVDLFKQQVLPGDILLSCSDGLWEMVRNPEIERILHNAPDPQTACSQLIEAANTNGGEDNISAVVAFIH